MRRCCIGLFGKKLKRICKNVLKKLTGWHILKAIRGPSKP